LFLFSGAAVMVFKVLQIIERIAIASVPN